MKRIWIMAAVGAAAIAAPALAQSKADPVKAGVEAWTRGDYKAAIDDWRGPAVAGDADAEFNLGQAYKLGRGVTADMAQAEQWYRKAAVQGHQQAEDNYGLMLFRNGKRADALSWLTRSADRGEPRAQFVLATMYFNGDSVEKNWPRAYALMTRASQAGLPQASKSLGQMDQYVSLSDRQQGLELAREYEAKAGHAQLASEFGVSAPIAAPAPAKPAPAKPRPAPVAVAARPPAPAVRDGGWRVQLGAFGEPGNARKLWSQVAARFPGRQPYYVKAGKLTKLLVGPYGNSAEANRACAAVKPCVPVAP